MNSLGKQYFPKNNALLYRMPKSELRAIAKMPCPIVLLADQKKPTEDQTEVILSSKKLREFLNVKED